MSFVLAAVAIADDIFRWDGWRAIAAVGTFAAVWAALNRDVRADRRVAIKEAHLIGAMIALADGALEFAKQYESNKNNLVKIKSTLDDYAELGGMAAINTCIGGIKVSECPTIEVMTTYSVLLSSFERVTAIYNELDLKIKSNAVSKLPSLAFEIKIIKQCIADLQVELKGVSGRFYDWAHQDGHRKKVSEKINGTARLRALRSVPALIRALITNREPKRS